MSITAIDPVAALVVIDLQNGILGLPTTHPADAVVERSARLAAAFRAHGHPVALVNVAGGAPGRTEQQRSRAAFTPESIELAPALDAQPEDIRVTKRTWGAFTGTDLEVRLRSAGVTQIVLAGISTSIGVESTARQAHELGFHVALATDAMTDTNAQSHAHSVSTVFPRLGETGTTEEILGLLAATEA